MGVLLGEIPKDKNDLDIKRLGLETLKKKLEQKISDLEAEKGSKQIV